MPRHLIINVCPHSGEGGGNQVKQKQLICGNVIETFKNKKKRSKKRKIKHKYNKKRKKMSKTNKINEKITQNHKIRQNQNLKIFQNPKKSSKKLNKLGFGSNFHGKPKQIQMIQVGDKFYPI